MPDMWMYLTRPRRGSLVLLLALSSLSCTSSPGYREVTIRARDYAYDVPDSLPAGPVAFALENTGRVAHEVVITELRPGATLATILSRDKADSTWRDLRYPPSGVLTADSGVTTPGRLLITLVAGRTYLLLCNFRDSDTSAVHFYIGMAHLVRAF
jgi:hypothetical protein